MHELFSWFQTLTDGLLTLVPRRKIVRKTDRLIKFRWDGTVVEKGPGLRWYLPLTTEVVELTVVRQPLDIPVIQFTTSDLKSCAADCSVTYYISDAIVFLTENFDGHLAINELIRAALSKKMRSMTFEAIQNSETIDDQLRESVMEDCELFGVEIEYVRLNKFVQIIPISLIGEKRE
jgi:regulator of protease activity HflC (stomatin/prohibitin superfamily)